MAVSLLNVKLTHEICNARKDLGMQRSGNFDEDPGAGVRLANKNALVKYFTNLASVPDKRTLIIPEGDYWMDPIGEVSTAEWRNLDIKGEASNEYACEHEVKQTPVDRHISRIKWLPTSNSTPFFKIVGADDDAVRPGIIRWSNLAVMRMADYGDTFLIGDPTKACISGTFPNIIRGCCFAGMYVDHGGHYSSTGLTANQHGLTNIYDAGSGDYRIQKVDTGRHFVFSCVYDLTLRDIGTRGGGREQILISNCDLVQAIGLHGMTGWRHLLVAPVGGNNSGTYVNGSGGRIASCDGTPGHYGGIKTEHMFLNGIAIFSGDVLGSVEDGGDNHRDVIAGRYAMPTGVTWSIAAPSGSPLVGAEKITFANLPSGTDPTDYFYPYQLIELTIKNTGGKPRRKDWLITTHVDSTGVYFAGYNTTSYYTAALTAQSATTIHRHFGTCAILGGGRTSAPALRFNASNNRTGCPVLALWPQNGSLTVGASMNGKSFQSVDSTQWAVVCQHTAGDAEETDNFVNWNGAGEYPNHPAIISSVPQNLRNRKPPAKTRYEVERDQYDFFLTPGRGVISGATWGLRELPYYFFEDPKNGNLTIPMYRPADNAEGIILYNASYPDFPQLEASIWDVRLWSDGSITNAIRVYNGSTFAAYNSSNGWQTLRLVPATGSNWVLYGIGEAYISWIGIKVAPFTRFPLETSSAGEASTTQYPHDTMWGFHTNTAASNAIKLVRNQGGNIIKTSALS